MKFCTLNIFLAILLFASSLYSQEQDTLYVNESYLRISKIDFRKKLKSNLYYGKYYDTDSIIYNRLFLKYHIGKLDAKKKSQLFSLLNTRNNVDTTKSILIHYLDTLNRDFNQKNKLSSRDSITTKDERFKNFYESHKSCLEENNSPFLNVYHFITFNNNPPTEIEGVTWNFDHLDLIKKLFYNHDKSGWWWNVIIHPNGDFAIKNSFINPNKWDKLKKKKNWEGLRKRFYKKYYSLNPHLNSFNNLKSKLR